MCNVELLAPAGNMECFQAAIQAGADAVYIGGQKFGARAFAGNFSDEEVIEALKIAHFWNRKVYLTVNTLLKEDELSQVAEYLQPFYEAGLDGVIVQDLGVLKVCKEKLPGLALHASTQLTVTESGAANLLKELGVERVVPARELSLHEIRRLKEESGLEIETFIHGALCYAYSGQCLFSSFLGGRSGNRGRCAQPCRQPYHCSLEQKRSKEEQYPLSLKDLCVLPILPSLIDAGIDSFKIEGRMKSAEYVAGVTSIYRKYIDLYRLYPDNWKVEKADLERLSGLYVRSGLEQGYYERHNGREMVTLDKPGYSGCSDALLEDIQKNILQKQMARPVELKMTLTPGMPSYLEAFCKLEDGTILENSSEGMLVSTAQKRPLSEEDIYKQLKKTGGSGFFTQKIQTQINGQVFLPVGAMNDLRRQVLDGLYKKVTDYYEIPSRKRAELRSRQLPPLPQNATTGSDAFLEKNSPVMQIRASVLTRYQAAEAVSHPAVGRLYLSVDALLSEKELSFAKDQGKIQSVSVSQLIQLIRERKEKDDNFSFFITLPTILRDYSMNWLKKLDSWIKENNRLVNGICCCSISGIAACQRFGWNKLISLSASAYTWNKASLAQYELFHAIESYTAPLELNRTNLFSLPKDRMELTVYGRLPMMISAGCIRKTMGDCKIMHTEQSLKEGIDRRTMEVSLTDRYQAKFPVLTNCIHCMNTIYNSVPLSLYTYLDEIKDAGIKAVRLEFTDETNQQTGAVLNLFAYQQGEPIPSFTTGHYKKGAQ